MKWDERFEDMQRTIARQQCEAMLQMDALVALPIGGNRIQMVDRSDLPYLAAWHLSEPGALLIAHERRLAARRAERRAARRAIWRRR